MFIETWNKFKTSSKNDLLQRLLRGTVNPWLVKFTSLPDCKLEKSIVIFGGPRSGTTWLAEILNTIPKSGLIFEPLYLSKVREARVAGVERHAYLPPGEKWPAGELFFRKMLDGKVLNSWTTSFMPLKRAVRPNLWVIKMIRANMMLSWMLDKFPSLKPVLIIRHPCSTILSMRQMGWPPPTRRPHFPKFESTFPHIRSIVEKLNHPIEYSAAMWCISYYPTLLHTLYNKHIVVSYERLVREGDKELKRIFDYLQILQPKEAVDQLRRFSRMTKIDSPIHETGDPLAKWSEKLSPEEIKMILNVVKAFGMDFYDENYEPNYERLYSQCPIRDSFNNVAI
jgi:hypothetical protein